MSNLEALSFLSAANPDYIADLYAKYQQNPSSVDESWSVLFTGLGDDARQIIAELKGASWKPSPAKLAAVLSTTANEEKPAPKKDAKAPAAAPVVDKNAVQDAVRAALLRRAYEEYGHMLANLDPLNLTPEKYHPDLDASRYGFSQADQVQGLLSQLRATYCSTIGAEFMHIQDPQQRDWVREKMERRALASNEERKHFLTRLTAAEGFEAFAHMKYQGVKRFGIDGGESCIAAVEEMITQAARMGCREVGIGMAHRGRLNVLTNVAGKSFTAMFAEFNGVYAKPEGIPGSSDVKYHMGYSSDRELGGQTVHVSLMYNPSHLEVVNPVVVGKTRAKQAQRNDETRKQVMPILIHGDAAVAGQGVVPETLMMADLPGYTVGGTVHIVVNNQVGFTTSPQFSRSGPYCTDVAKMIQSPIFHVNGDDVDAVMWVARVAAEYRMTFGKDIFVDVVCYRRYGHNESDEPAFTQPGMYKIIAEKKSIRTVYAEKLVAQGVLSQADADKIEKDFRALLDQEFESAKTYKPNRADMLEGKWQGIKQVVGARVPKSETGIEAATFKKIGAALTTIPDGFDLNSKIARQLEAKKKMFEAGEGFDWATAEALAFGSLALEGHPVRLSGQDCGRGTFSQRHAVLTDQANEKRYVPLASLGAVDVLDSPLSEEAVLGFEYGYSSAEPNSLTLWEGQFGDFVNGAQVIIDQFIASAETKWLRMSGLVMLLPHGFEGQGPEHSSARPERFLQLCAEDNWSVANVSTPANYFHILRRQLKRDFRKPLILMTPKSLLRHKLCVSKTEEFTGNTSFRLVIGDEAVKKAKRVVLCAGKVYYDLLEAREKAGIKDVALVRLEQFYPFPEKTLAAELKKYPGAEVIWCQEEPENQGAWNFLDRRIEKAMEASGNKARPTYVGRTAAAAPATGSLKQHQKEQEYLIKQALGE